MGQNNSDDDDMIAIWDQTSVLVNKGTLGIEIIPPYLYDWADKNGNIETTPAGKREYIESATLYRHSAIAKAYKSNPHSLETKKMFTEFNAMRETKKYSPSEHQIIEMIAKKMIIYKMMRINQFNSTPINQQNEQSHLSRSTTNQQENAESVAS